MVLGLLLAPAFAQAQVRFVGPANGAPAVVAPSSGVPLGNAGASGTVAPLGEPRPLAVPATAKPVNAVAPAAVAEVHGLIERGRLLESQRRWGEALTLYEDGLRSWPHDVDLTQRFNLSRVHYDLGRRYSDVSFRDSVTQLQSSEALELFGEVLLKVQSHYVEAPNWPQLLNQGTTALDTALTDPIFIEQHLASVPAAKVDHFRRVLHDRLDIHSGELKIDNRQRTMDAVSLAGRLAHDELGLSETAVILEYVCGVANSLDPYSTYLTPAQLNEVYSQIEGNFVGLGVELKPNDGSLQIVKVITGSPAERAGIRSGDRIVAVDGRATRDMSTDQAANMLQGKEGTSVDVTVVSAGYAPRVVRVRREQVEVPSVDTVRIIDQTAGIGYCRITCFQKTTSRDLDTALWKLHREGMRSLIVDLRGNPGGLLTSSVDLVDKFVDRGVIVSTRGRAAQEDYNYQAHQAGTWRVPLVVLIDGDSASASEIFAGAIRDHRRGTIVGTRSYGKGSVQGIFPLGVANAGLRLTTAKFYSPNGLPYSQVGVSPDVLVQEVAKPVTADGQPPVVAAAADNALEAAKNVARRQVARR